MSTEGEVGLGPSFGTGMLSDASKERRGMASCQEEKRARGPGGQGRGVSRRTALPAMPQAMWKEAEHCSLTSCHEKGRFDGGAGAEAR